MEKDRTVVVQKCLYVMGDPSKYAKGIRELLRELHDVCSKMEKQKTMKIYTSRNDCIMSSRVSWICWIPFVALINTLVPPTA